MKKIPVQEKGFWDDFAEKYDPFMEKHAGAYEQLTGDIRSELKAGDHVLELATGTGLISLAIHEHAKKITAVDFSPRMIQLASEKKNNRGIKNIDFQVGDIYHLNFEACTFDVIIAANILHLLTSPEKVLSEMYRMLKDDGRIMLPNYCHGENLRSQIISRIMALAGFRAKNRWSIKNYKKFIEDQQFIITGGKRYKGKIPLYNVIARKQI
jgi:ubiquinone/menaquinone biosynthesis C-methylase UbiE